MHCFFVFLQFWYFSKTFIITRNSEYIIMMKKKILHISHTFVMDHVMSLLPSGQLPLGSNRCPWLHFGEPISPRLCDNRDKSPTPFTTQFQMDEITLNWCIQNWRYQSQQRTRWESSIVNMNFLSITPQHEYYIAAIKSPNLWHHNTFYMWN